jgi:hypothetical protein
LKHYAASDFWGCYRALPIGIRNLADRSFDRLKHDPRHPSLHFKKVGRYWSARIGAHHRALAVEVEDGCLWFWIGTHGDYDKMIG